MSHIFDKTKFNGRIRISGDRKTAVWVAEVTRRNGRTFRTAGQAPIEMTAHGLIAIGLTTTLATWSRFRPVGKISQKLNLLVTTNDEAFAEALQALRTKNREQIAATPFRVGKNLQIELARQLAKFNVSLEQEQDDELSQPFKDLRIWSRAHVPDPKALQLAAMYHPVAASEIVWL